MVKVGERWFLAAKSYAGLMLAGWEGLTVLELSGEAAWTRGTRKVGDAEVVRLLAA